jgi:hypothetical protein
LYWGSRIHALADSIEADGDNHPDRRRQHVPIAHAKANRDKKRETRMQRNDNVGFATDFSRA